jgi:hypothetical protein
MQTYGPFSKSDGTILNQYMMTAEGQWQAGNAGTFADLGQLRQVQAEITERYQTVKNGQFMFKGNFYVLLPNPIETHTPIPPGDRVGVEGNNIYILLP